VEDQPTNCAQNYHSFPVCVWQVSDVPNDYIAMQLKGIVALVPHFTKLFGVRKLSQNNTPADRDGVIAGQTRDNPALGQVLARKIAG
jgi:transcriptional regulator